VCDAKLVEVVFPHLAGVVIDEVTADGGVLQIRARPSQVTAACPDCATVSAAVHSRYVSALKYFRRSEWFSLT
jgi:hypothetical protein